jgi:nucleotide-binding universal stress UspA family protein
MYGHVLIATDGSELAWKAVEHGLALAQKLDARVTAITVTEPLLMMLGQPAAPMPLDQYDEAVRASAASILTPIADEARKHGVACEILHVKDRFPAEGIVEIAKERNCDLIVMASHGRRGLAKLLLGSQATDVLTHSPTPVLICR